MTEAQVLGGALCPLGNCRVWRGLAVALGRGAPGPGVEAPGAGRPPTEGNPAARVPVLNEDGGI